MKQNIITATLVAATLAVAATSCGIYKKYQTPDNTPLTAEYVQARQNNVDSTALGNLLWEEVFTDPVLADLIDRALASSSTLPTLDSTSTLPGLNCAEPNWRTSPQYHLRLTAREAP